MFVVASGTLVYLPPRSIILLSSIWWSYMSLYSLWSVLYVSLAHFIMYAGSVYTGVEFSKRLCGISVIRRYQLFLNFFPLYACLGSNRVNDLGTHKRRKKWALYSITITVISLC